VGPTQPPVQQVLVLSQRLKWTACGAELPPDLVLRFKKIELLPFWVFVACYRVNITLLFLSTETIKGNGSVLNATCSTVWIDRQTETADRTFQTVSLTVPAD